MSSESILRMANKKHYVDKDYDEASRLYQQIIDQFPDSLEARLAKKQLDEIAKQPRPQQTEYKKSETVQTAVSSEKKSRNIISLIIKTFGYIHIFVVIAAGIGAGILLSLLNIFTELESWVYVIPLAIAIINSFFGFMLLGFAEIIQLLHEMNERSK